LRQIDEKVKSFSGSRQTIFWIIIHIQLSRLHTKDICNLLPGSADKKFSEEIYTVRCIACSPDVGMDKSADKFHLIHIESW